MKFHVLGMSFVVLLAASMLWGGTTPATRPVNPSSSLDTPIDPNVKRILNVEYAQVAGQSLKLDLYLPRIKPEPNDALSRPPLIVWIHGGGWTEGDRVPCRTLWMASRGYAVASISYRLAPAFTCPAQLHDCKGAIRWLRAHAADYGYDPDRIGVCGESAGGQLVAMLGLTEGNKAMEGTVGGNLKTSSAVQAVCEMYGPSDLLRLVTERVPGTVDITKIITRFLGGTIEEKHDLAVLASPLHFVNAKAPPFLIVHGDHDPLVAVDQAWYLFKALRAVKAPVELWIVPNGSHRIRIMGTPQFEPRLNAFFDRYLLHAPAQHP